MHIKSIRITAAEAGSFEDKLIEEGFILVVKENPDELHRKEYLKTLSGTSEQYVGEEYIFTWKE